jgi:hypothetical protein
VPQLPCKTRDKMPSSIETANLENQPSPEKADDDLSAQLRAPDLVEELQNLQCRIQTTSFAETFWHDILSKREQKRLGSSLEKAWEEYQSTLGMATKAWSCTAGEALIRICREYGSMSSSRIDRLEQALGNSKRSKTREEMDLQPEWRKDEAKLYFRGEVVRTIRSIARAQNVVRILDAFQNGDWPTRVDDPLRYKDPHQLRETVRSLNRGLSLIRFKMDGASKGVCWGRADSRATHAPDT